jgi:DNA-binding MarR family transcriptional regulator
MEKHGVIKRTKDMERKNRIRITLTAKGEKALKQAMKQEGATGIIARLSTVQQKQLKASLTALK